MSKIKADWLQSDLVLKVVDVLGADNIRFVGGAVRDTLLGLDVEDIDAATLHKPDKTMVLLKAAGVKVIPTGLQHGTVTAVLDKAHIEITTLRVDVETDGRHAEVSFTESWLEDAKRRDFTFNALYLTPSGDLFDPFGGESDLIAGRVQFIGDAEERIKEDALRIMRFFRFHAHFGKGSVATPALEACSRLASMLKALSVERIRMELSKLLKAENPLPALHAMQEAGIFTTLEKKVADLSDFGNFLANEKVLGADAEPLARLCFLFKGKLGALELARWLKLSTKNKAFLKSLEGALQAEYPSGEKAIRCYIYHHGSDAAKVAAIHMGDRALYQYSQSWEVPRFPLQGRDLMAGGMLAGPAVGETLKCLEKDWLDSDFSLGKQELLTRL